MLAAVKRVLFEPALRCSAASPAVLHAFTALVVAALGSGRRFKLLFRSGSAGTPASAPAFHSRCDGKDPTVTLIRDTAGNVFCGSTSLNWNGSTAGGWVYFADPTAFLFTIVNPHGDPPALFPGKTNANGYSIICRATIGPCFAGLYVMFGATSAEKTKRPKTVVKKQFAQFWKYIALAVTIFLMWMRL